MSKKCKAASKQKRLQKKGLLKPPTPLNTKVGRTRVRTQNPPEHGRNQSSAEVRERDYISPLDSVETQVVPNVSGKPNLLSGLSVGNMAIHKISETLSIIVPDDREEIRGKVITTKKPCKGIINPKDCIGCAYRSSAPLHCKSCGNYGKG